MPDKTDPREFRQANRKAWEEAAPIHARHNLEALLEAFATPGHSCLDAVATTALQGLGVIEKDVAQVGCNNGCELISVKNLGAARCVGFDVAQGFVDQGHTLAKAAGHDVSFVCCDAYEIPPAYHRSFDIVLITIGVLGWMPDIHGFFAEMEKLLKPGGAIFIYEHHPILVMAKPGPADAPVEWELSYFRNEPYVDAGGLDYYGGEGYDATPNISFSHKLSDILMAGVKSDLTVEAFDELPHHISNAWWNVEHSGIGLPMCYTLVLRKAGDQASTSSTS
ncbi:MAG: class I SAM-dependent methyltransferase [Pseudomonadota bacterium]